MAIRRLLPRRRELRRRERLRDLLRFLRAMLPPFLPIRARIARDHDFHDLNPFGGFRRLRVLRRLEVERRRLRGLSNHFIG